MAWVGLGAVVGLALCGLWLLTNVVRDRTARDAPTGAEPGRTSRGRMAALIAIGATGILLLGVVVFLVGIDLEGAGSDGSSSASATAPVTTTLLPPGDRQHPPNQVRIDLANASGFARLASKVGDSLKSMGYVITGPTTTVVQQGSTVTCRDGFAADAVWLKYLLGGTTDNLPFPNPPPPELANFDCVIVVGREL
jgi:hypothetical protein